MHVRGLKYSLPEPSATPPTTWNDAAREIKRLLAPYSLTSIIEHAITILDHWRGKGLEEVRSAPWITLLILKLALEDDRVSIDGGLPCTSATLDRLRNMVWNTPHFGDDDKPSAFLMVRALMHTQVVFQRKQTWSFLRWPALIAELDVEHPTRKQFVAMFGMEPDAWGALALATAVASLEGKTFIAREWFDPLREGYGSAVDTFLGMITRDARALRAELRAELHDRMYVTEDGKRTLRPGGESRPKRELYEFPWVVKYPLFAHHNGHLGIWHRNVLTEGLNNAVHNRLSDLGQQYTDGFSSVFEQHVVDLARWSGLPVIDEATYKAAGRRSLKAVDCIIPLGEANILIESKMSLFPDQVLISDRGPHVFMKLKRVREAILQGWKVGDLLRDGSVDLPQCTAAPVDYLLIVTSRQLNAGFGENFKQMFGENIFERLNPDVPGSAPTQAQLARLPSSHIFVLSIEEFEDLAAGIKAGHVDLLTMLRDVTESISQPGGARMFFHQVLQNRDRSDWQKCRLMEEAIERVMADVVSRLQDQIAAEGIGEARR